MKKGTKLVDQINSDGTVTKDVCTSLSNSEIEKVMKKYCPGIEPVKFEGFKTALVSEVNEQKYAIRIKNITYLGNPHPDFKFRIQISNDLKVFKSECDKKNIVPILLGIYTHDDVTIFTDFEVNDYIDKKAHNSSAHVYVNDLLKGFEHGYFQKIDAFNNHVTTFTPDKLNDFLESKVGATETKHELEIASVMNDFMDILEKDWDGRVCIDEMVKNNYNNAYQAEWPGYYLEYAFEKQIKNNNLEGFVTYLQDKTEGGIDLDLYFPTLNAYGDLKAHTVTTGGIQGNDWETIQTLINPPYNKSIYYIVVNHETEKDIDSGSELTRYWNKLKSENKGKEYNPLSYEKRMKKSVKLVSYYILEINQYNKQYLSEYKQGHNSNGKPRKCKIKIDDKAINNFLVYKKEFAVDSMN